MHSLVKEIIFHVSGIDLEFQKIEYTYKTENEMRGLGGLSQEMYDNWVYIFKF